MLHFTRCLRQTGKFLLLLLSISFSNQVTAQTDIEIIQERFFQTFIATPDVSVLDETIAQNLNDQSPDGSWSDIDYEAEPDAKFPAETHLTRLEAYAKGYSNTASTYYGSGTLLSRMETTLQYWVDNMSKPAVQSGNQPGWYFFSISIPKRFANILIATRRMPTGFSTTSEDEIFGWMTAGRPISDFTEEGGSNLTDVATHYVMRACLKNDADLLSETVGYVANSIKIAEVGIQLDNSFKAHGSQLYIYGYGGEFVKGISTIGTNIAGTAYAFSAEKMAIFSSFMRNGFIKPVRGGHVDFNLFGRGISRPNNGRAPISLTEAVSKIDLPAHSSEYADAIARMKKEQPASYNISPEHTHYWTTDYSLHTRPGYTFGLRAVSTRTVKSEQGNGEGIKINFMTDGATYIGVAGDEYYNIYPTWDWNKIPGTTAPEVATFPDVTDWGFNFGKTSFVGGVSDGVYGASAFSLNDYNTTAKKGWFFFDDEIVCLGAGIGSSAPEAINTTVNQSHLTTDVIASTTAATSTLSTGL